MLPKVNQIKKTKFKNKEEVLDRFLKILWKKEVQNKINIK